MTPKAKKREYYYIYTVYPNKSSDTNIWVPNNWYFGLGNTISSMFVSLKKGVKWGRYKSVKYGKIWISYPKNLSTFIYCVLRPKSLYSYESQEA